MGNPPFKYISTCYSADHLALIAHILLCRWTPFVDGFFPSLFRMLAYSLTHSFTLICGKHQKNVERIMQVFVSGKIATENSNMNEWNKYIRTVCAYYYNIVEYTNDYHSITIRVYEKNACGKWFLPMMHKSISYILCIVTWFKYRKHTTSLTVCGN